MGKIAFYKKKYILFLISMSFFTCVFAQLFDDKPDLYTIKTTYFDIIYPQDSEESAKLLALKADEMYREVTAFFNVTFNERIPVVITSDMDILNAYYTSFPYNRIVLFDTLPVDDELSVFSNTMESVFVHELTHYVTANIKNPIWKGLSFVFGDAVSPSYMLNTLPIFSEGASIYLESITGEGRLNNPYSMQPLLQAKVEGTFLSWEDASIARAPHLGTIPYAYGGAFALYLIRTYGRDAYAQFWKETGKLQFGFVKGAFKDAFGISISDAWLDFEQAVPTPIVEDPNAYNQKKLCNKRSKYKSLTTSENNVIAWVDESSSKVYIKKSPSEEPKVLFSYASINRVDLSPDGSLLLISVSELTTATLFRDTVKVFDVNKGQFIYDTKYHLRETCFLTMPNGEPAIAGVHVVSQKASLQIYSDFKIYKQLDFALGTKIYNPIDLGDGIIAFILDKETIKSVAFYDLKTDELKILQTTSEADISLSKIARAHYSTENELPRLLFTYSQTRQLSQYAYMTVDLQNNKASIDLVDKNFSGGMQNVVMYNGGLAYIANFTEYDAVYAINEIETFYAEDYPITPFTIEHPPVPINIAFSESIKNSDGSISEPKKYNPLPYLIEGIFLPIAADVPVTFQTTSLEPEFLGLGTTYITSDPSERYTVLLSAGYDFFTDDSLFYANFSNTVTPVNWSVSSRLIVEETLYKELTSIFTVSHLLPLSNSLFYFYFENSFEHLTNFEDWRAVNVMQGYFSTIRRKGLGHYDLSGIKLGVMPYFYLNPMEKNVMAIVGFALSGLLPIQNPYNFTVRLPLTVDVLTGYEYADILAKLTLFSAEIQEPVPFLSFYADRITFDGLYESIVTWQGEQRTQIIHSDMFLTLSPHFGYFSEVNMNLGTRFTYDIQEKNWFFSFKGALSL